VSACINLGISWARMEMKAMIFTIHHSKKCLMNKMSKRLRLLQAKLKNSKSNNQRDKKGLRWRRTRYKRTQKYGEINTSLTSHKLLKRICHKNGYNKIICSLSNLHRKEEEYQRKAVKITSIISMEWRSRALFLLLLWKRNYGRSYKKWRGKQKW